MGLRETLQRNPTTVKVIASVLIVMCIGTLFVEMRAGRQELIISNIGKDFYSDDDGRTWFLSDALNGSPFDHNGKQAYRALVFRCAGSRPFVAYLAKYTDEQMARWKAEAGKNPEGQTRVVGEIPGQWKKPGDPNWSRGLAGEGLPVVMCPDGHPGALAVSPVDEDTGATN